VSDMIYHQLLIFSSVPKRTKTKLGFKNLNHHSVRPTLH